MLFANIPKDLNLLANMKMKLLIVLTSHDKLGSTGQKTGFWLEEFAAPFYVFQDAGAEITLASPLGGQPPLDPKSDERDFQTPATERFNNDSMAQQLLANTNQLSDVNADDYDAVFYPGGHGPLWDLSVDKLSIELIEKMAKAGKPIGTVCHASGVLKHVKVGDDYLVKDRSVTGFSNSEEAAVELTDIVPFLLENDLQEKGGKYSKGDDWEPYVCVDDFLVTGQNPASSELVAQKLIELLS